MFCAVMILGHQNTCIMEDSSMKKILVVGSLNMDTVIETPRIPVPGETIMGNGIKHVPGGKGANQVYTIGKLG